MSRIPPPGRLAALLLGLLAFPAFAQPARIDVQAGVEQLSGPYDDGRVLRLAYVTPGPDGGAWRVDADLSQRFGERGLGLGIHHARDVGDRWTASGYAGTGTNNIYLPRLRLGIEGGRKWGQRWVTAVGVGVFDAYDVHRDLLLHAEARRYGERWVLQGGGRVTVSSPGSAVGAQASVAATHISPRGRWITARVAGGHEAWLVVEPAPLRVGFESIEGSLSVRQPVAGALGVLASATHLRNPFYTRTTIEGGVTLRLP